MREKDPQETAHRKAMGLRIKRAREAAGMTQAALATRIQRDFSTISKWERGEMEPGVDAIVAISDATSVAIEWLAAARGEGPHDLLSATGTEG